MSSLSLLVSGIFTSSCGFILAYQKRQDPILLAALNIIGRFGVTIAYNSGAQYATELIPTCVRAQGVACAHVAGYAFTFFSSYILYTVCDAEKSQVSFFFDIFLNLFLAFREQSSKLVHP